VGTSAGRAGTSAGCTGTSGCAETSASYAGTPVQCGGDRTCDQDMGLRQQQQERDEERVDQEREPSHPRQAQVTSNGHKVSVLVLFTRPCT